MSNINITNNDLGSVELEGGQFRDDVLTLAGADVIKAGTILARSTASEKLVLFVKGGSTAGNGVPCVVLTYEIVSTGAGDTQMRALVAGTVRLPRLVIDADGDNSNIDAPVLDQLRSRSIVTADVQELNILDNQ